MFRADSKSEIDYKNETYKHPSQQILNKTIKIRNWYEAARIAHNDETFARIPDIDNSLPIHTAVSLGCTTELVTILLKAYPECIIIRDCNGNLPIHLAAKHRRDKIWLDLNEISSILYLAYPRGLAEKDSNGNIPIHLAIRSRAPDDMVYFFLKSYPESAKLTDQFGNLPLHLALQFEANYSVVHELIKVYPKSTTIKNAQGALTLHKATQFRSSMDIINMLLESNPDAITVADNRGNLPLHLLYLSCVGPPEELRLRTYLQRNPIALSMKNNNGKTPFMVMNSPEEHYLEDYR